MATLTKAEIDAIEARLAKALATKAALILDSGPCNAKDLDEFIDMTLSLPADTEVLLAAYKELEAEKCSLMARMLARDAGARAGQKDWERCAIQAAADVAALRARIKELEAEQAEGASL